jgi:hypothetical protein
MISLWQPIFVQSKVNKAGCDGDVTVTVSSPKTGDWPKET